MIQLAESIINGQAVAVSNGSFQDQHGSAEWTIESKSSQHWIVSKGRTPGTSTDQSAYWSKLFGLWGIFWDLNQFTATIQIPHSHIIVTGNGLSVL